MASIGYQNGSTGIHLRVFKNPHARFPSVRALIHARSRPQRLELPRAVRLPRLPAVPEDAVLVPVAVGRRPATAPIRPIVVSMKQAASMLGIGKNTMYAAIADGRIPHVKVGSRILIPVSRHEEGLAENTLLGGI